MTYIFLAGAVVVVLVLIGRTRKAQWRPISAVLAIGALTVGATLLALKVFVPGVALIGLAALLALGARARSQPSVPPKADAGPYADITLAQARAVLGVEAGATRDEIQSAYRRLMALNHPDKGGTSGLATQLNTARDKLLRQPPA